MADLSLNDIRTRVMNQLRIPTTNATEETKVIALINEVYRDVYAKEDWWWALKRQIVNTLNDVTTGTASVTNSSTSVTMSSALPVAIDNYRFLVTGDQDLAAYLVSTGASGATAVQLDSLYMGVTSTSVSYRATRDSYSLAADTNKVLSVRRYGRDLPMKRVGWDTMAWYKSNSRTVGKPEVYCVYDHATTGDPQTARLIQIHPYPDDTYRLEILYKQTLNTEIATTTEFFLPDDYRQVLIYGALARGYPIFLNDTERGTYFQTLFNDVMNLMMAAQREYARDLPSLAPDDSYRRADRPRRAGGYTLGSLFDRYPMERW